MADLSKAAPVDPPRGSFQARVDEKGRLKLPAAFQQYLTDLGERKVFITSLDALTARIYPISVWKENEKFFDEAVDEDAEVAAQMHFVANHYGADSEIDGQGRVLVPTELRRELKIENESVWLESHKGRINVYSPAEYETRRAAALSDLPGKLKRMEQRGLK